MRLGKLLVGTLIATTVLAGAVQAQPQGIRRFVGTWSGTELRQGVAVIGKTTYAADGTFRLAVVIRRPSATPDFIQVEGTWRSEEGYLVEVITKTSNESLAPLGSTTRDRIVKVTSEVLELQAESGRNLVRYRE